MLKSEIDPRTDYALREKSTPDAPLQRVPTYAHKDDHVAIFPEALAERCIRIGSRPGDTVFDPFAGSGTTGVAAERLGRRAILIDSSEEYCQSMKRRFVGEDAISADDERWEG
jgi:site-specific DNA-methyltransferase (cytosine-N4-specific)